MQFVKTSDLWKNSYFLSNRSSFLFRYCDSGFKDKWTGLWHRENKFLDFLAFRLDNEWLSEDACKRLVYNGRKAIHSFRVKGGAVRQEMSLGDDGSLLVELSGRMGMNLVLRLAVNIRKRCENRTSRRYETRERDGRLHIHNELGSLRVSCSRKMNLTGKPDYLEHCPSSEPQNYFMPGSISASGNPVCFRFTPSLEGSQSHNPPKKKPQREKLRDFSSLLRSDSKLLQRGFCWSALATELCRKSGSGIVSWYAGLPWFQHFWARDIFWITPSLTALGYLGEVRDTLLFFGKNAEKGRIPNRVSETEGKCMNGIDPTPLWLISLEDYAMNSGDLGFLKKMRPVIEDCTAYLLSCDRDNDGYIEHDSTFPETWMDTIKRGSMAVDIQALFHRALLASSSMLSMISGRGLSAINKAAARLGSSFERDFFQNGFFLDRFFWKQAVPTRTANSLVPMLCGFSGHSREVLEAIESAPFTTDAGVRTRAGGEAGFDPAGYHTGQAWSLTTAWACAAEFLANRPSKGWRYLRILLSDMDRQALGCIGECWNSSNLSLSGSPLQLWGSGFIPRLVDEFMLGIRVNALDRTVTVSPRLPPSVSSVRRVRHTGLGPVTLNFRRTGKSVKTILSGKRFKLVRE
jgi:hypothetical protein